MKRLGAACLACVALGLAAGGSSALASTAKIGEGRLIIDTPTTAPAQVNNIEIKSTPTGLTVTDTSGIAPEAGSTKCTTVDTNTVQCSSAGVDRIFADAGDGNDTIRNSTSLAADLRGGAGDDKVFGGTGKDDVRGGPGVDEVHGGDGDDTLRTRGDVTDYVYCDAGGDTVFADPVDFVNNDCETVDRGSGPVTGPQPPPPAPGPGGPAVISPSPAGTANPQPVTVPAGKCQTKYIGKQGDDRIDGSTLSDLIFGLGGNDTIVGYAADDCIFGGAGADTVFAGGGADLVSGEAGDDKLYGQDGNDRVGGGAGNDRITGDAGNDRLSGAAGRDRIRAGSGNDTLNGGLGADFLDGGAGADTILGYPGNDRLLGGLGNDHLSGGSGNDVVSGGSGRDVLSGGPGKNVLRGGPGNDRINARNGKRDVVDCGTGTDTVRADKVDALRGCEKNQ